MYDAVVFDMDGVLLQRHADYPDVYRQAVEAAFRAFDVDPDDAAVAAFYGGASKTVEEMRRACERHGVDLEAFWPERERRSSALQRRMVERGERDLYDDAAAVAALAGTHDLAVVSSNQQATVEFVVEQFGLDDHFETVYGREPTVEGYRRTKPDTYYVERAMADVGASSGLYVGDAPSDVVAAHRAGLDSAFVRRDHAPDDLPEEPTYEVERLSVLEDLLSRP